MTSGASLALLSALLFGISPALTKPLIGNLSPVVLAGLLYLGSGVGLLIISSLTGKGSFSEVRELSRRSRWKLLGAVASGGVIAPICLVFGIKLASAFEVSLFLNFETVTTSVIAWILFHEHVGASVWAGKAFILLGAVVLCVAPHAGGSLSLSSLLLVGACVFWGIDNNLTRDVEELSPAILASLKGLAAGSFNLALGWLLGAGETSTSHIIMILGVGAASYGLSLLLFVQALRLIGAARTSTYFATGPFLGMLFAVAFLGERPPLIQWMCGAIMGTGVWLLYREHHEHVHVHMSANHRHKHVHDEHHQHAHEGWEGPEPHDHAHVHEPLKHSHPHYPDIHHRHPHQ